MKTLMSYLWMLLHQVLTCIFIKARSIMSINNGANYTLSWRFAIESNNLRSWPTVPRRCLPYIKTYMLGGQYQHDLDMVIAEMLTYMNSIILNNDGKDIWILDVDDTCISNLKYYERKNFGCDPFDRVMFKSWILEGSCPAIHSMLVFYKKLIERGFKVFLLTGRHEEQLGSITALNLLLQGYVGHERLILRSSKYKGQSAEKFKSAIRKEIEGEGYRIHGNVGDQWSDLTGESIGARTFKLPNPMYFVS
ncbi:acid phosphatase 1-like [Dioscorea cayenensis subsp. rotundata]|uniref:Acid phosphatase 1-like n=1 Tax=Dioscorea cayennensis subsp. rotundata TaxID=55577 RepID=A0AB40CBG1_DIOCR|nr:acid phosphatase 1-like [Dioscorea cayenensis subsp. rotundata]